MPPELRVTHHRRVTDAVERLDGVAEPHRVQATPPALSRGPAKTRGVELKVQVTVRVTGTRGVVPHRHRLDPLHRHLHLPTARPHPRRRVPSPSHADSDATCARLVGRDEVSHGQSLTGDEDTRSRAIVDELLRGDQMPQSATRADQ